MDAFKEYIGVLDIGDYWAVTIWITIRDFGREMGIFLLENRLGREGDRINVGLALIYMGLIDVLLELIDIG